MMPLPGALLLAILKKLRLIQKKYISNICLIRLEYYSHRIQRLELKKSTCAGTNYPQRLVRQIDQI